MGGYGSGGWNRKYVGTVEDAYHLDVHWLRNQGLLQNGRQQILTWSVNGLVQLDLQLAYQDHILHLCDPSTAGSPFPDKMHQRLQLSDRPRKVGGHITLFQCPSCKSYRKRLYLSVYRFICQDCAGLTYRSRRQRKVARALNRWDEISDRLGGVSWEGWCGLRKPKNMQWRTYNALLERLWAEEAIVVPHTSE